MRLKAQWKLVSGITAKTFELSQNFAPNVASRTET
jgi:hypothetical protein